MGGITEKITEFIKDLLTGWITSNLDTMFTDVNTKVETIAAEVGKTPQNWNSGIFSMIKNLSDNVIVPIAGMIITFVLCYELISMIMEKNNMHDTDTFMFFKYIFKMWVAVYLVTHTFDIAMAIFDVANHVVSNAGGMITGSASIDVTEALKTLLETQIEDMGIGELLGLGLETMLVSLCLKIISVLITVILYGPDKPAAQNIANSLQLYVTGSQNVFNHRSNVDTQNRVVCFDIRELGTTLRKAGMLIVQHMVWTRVSQNRSRRKSTRYYVDEFHLLLNQPQTANYSIEMWKRFRKWGGIITGISQNVTDFLGSLAVESIVGNSDFILMLNQHSGDQKILAEKLNISKHQISFVNNSNAGEGLLFYGNVIIPFADRYPQDTRTYALMSTKPDEIQT